MRAITEKQMDRIFSRIIKDYTYRRNRTTAELERRLKTFKAHSRNTGKLLLFISCLSETDVVSLFRENGKGRTIPVAKTSEGREYFFFTSEKHIVSKGYKAYETETTPLIDVLEDIDCDQNTYIVINPDTQCVCMSAALVKDLINGYNDTIGGIEQKLDSGMKGEEFDEVLFENLYDRKIDCELTDGAKVVGNVTKYEKTKKFGPTVYVQTENNGIVPVYMNKVKFVRDLTMSELTEWFRKQIVIKKKS